MKSAIMTKSQCGEDSENLDEKYQEQIRESQCLRMSREIRRKELEIVNLKEKCESLQSVINRDRTLFEKERNEWENFKGDLLLVVRAADDYKTEAIKTVEKYKKENSALEEKVYMLERTLQLAEGQESPHASRSRISLAVTKMEPFSDNKNKLDPPSPSDDSTSTSEYLDCVSRF